MKQVYAHTYINPVFIELPKRQGLVQGWHCFMSYQTGQVLEAGADCRSIQVPYQHWYDQFPLHPHLHPKNYSCISMEVLCMMVEGKYPESRKHPAQLWALQSLHVFHGTSMSMEGRQPNPYSSLEYTLYCKASKPPVCMDRIEMGMPSSQL